MQIGRWQRQPATAPVNWPRPPPTCCWGSSDLLLAGRLVGGVAFGSQPLALLHSLSARPESAQWRKATKKSPWVAHSGEKPNKYFPKMTHENLGLIGLPRLKIAQQILHPWHDSQEVIVLCDPLYLPSWIQMDEYLKPNMLIAQNYPGWLGGVHPSGTGWGEGGSQHIGSVEPNGGTSIAFTQLWTHLLRRTDGRRLPINWRRIEPSLTQLSFPPPSFPVETSPPSFLVETFNTRCISVLIVSSPITRQWMVNYQVIPSEPSVN